MLRAKLFALQEEERREKIATTRNPKCSTVFAKFTLDSEESEDDKEKDKARKRKEGLAAYKLSAMKLSRTWCPPFHRCSTCRIRYSRWR